MSNKAERLPHYVTVEDVDQAEQLLAEMLASGPLRPRVVKAEARRRGFDPYDEVWQCAKRRLSVKATQISPSVWQWALPGHEVVGDVEQEFYAWLDSKDGRFENYCAARDRLARSPIGRQLDLL